MHIALNASILRAPRTGIGQYIAGLSKALAQLPDTQLSFFTGMGWAQQLPANPQVGYSRLSALAKCLPNAYELRRYLQQQAFNRGVKEVRPALYHEPSLWPFDFDGPTVMTLHDLTHIHYPHTQPADRLAEIERRIGPALERAQHIITDSQFVANELSHYYSVSPDRISIAHLGYAERFHPRTSNYLESFTTRLSLKARHYLICVGTLEPRKNLPLALDAYNRLPEAVRQRYPLLIAGMAGWKEQALSQPLKAAINRGNVRLLGYLDDDTLAALLAGARMLLFPSLYEGFGLPVLEAMASGVPVILSPHAAMPEVAGNAGIYADQSAEDWRDAILRLIDDDLEWELRRNQGLQQAQQFSWSNCARITSAAYQKALE
ncbi:glycosyltransferase family 1 protein [Ectopseudomonas mendocina]|uniref:Glycosyltransferase family 1 protein n=1 Tax=Ectopseudomonas mendocina TaxID=300 RepID=A0ABZ2RPB0_ECTME